MLFRYLRILARAKRQKLGRPRTEPHEGNELEVVDVLEERDRVLGGDGGAAGGNIGCGSSIRDKLNTSCTVGLLLDFGSSVPFKFKKLIKKQNKRNCILRLISKVPKRGVSS